MGPSLDALLPGVHKRVVPTVRERLGKAVLTFLRGDAAGESPGFVPDGIDEGLFGPQSATWQVHSGLTGVVGGLRALMLQTMHPLTMAGVAQHSSYRGDAFGRLHRTAGFVGMTTFGSTAQADRAIRTVRKVHERVTGFAPDGRPYAANDPELLLWVHATEVDSFLRAHLRYAATPIRGGAVDGYVREMAEIARRLGAATPPETRAELRDYLMGMRPELRATREAHETTRFLLFPPLPAPARGPYLIVASAAVGMLPTFVRRALWIPPFAPGVEPAVVRPAATALLRVLDWAATGAIETRRSADGADIVGAPDVTEA